MTRSSSPCATTVLDSTCATCEGCSACFSGCIRRINSMGRAWDSRSSGGSSNVTGVGCGQRARSLSGRASRLRYPGGERRRMRRHTGRMLLVEDDRADTELALRVLRRMDVAADVDVVADGEAALEFVLGEGG